MEHRTHQEFQMIKKFLITGLTGNLPSGKKIKAALLDPYTLLLTWNKDYHVSLDRIGDLVTDVADWRAPQTPNERVMEVLGSLAYRTGLTLVPNSLNEVKASLWGLEKSVGTNKWSDLMRETAKGSTESASQLGKTLQETIGTFLYMNVNMVRDFLDQGRAKLLQELTNYENYMGMKGVVNIWKEFEPDHYAAIVANALAFRTRSINKIENCFSGQATIGNAAVAQLIFTARVLKQNLHQIRFLLD